MTRTGGSVPEHVDSYPRARPSTCENRLRVLVVTDSFGGTLTAREAATAIVDGWTAARPDDAVHVLPLSDGGEGLLEVLAPAAPTARRRTSEVCGPLGLPVAAEWLLNGSVATIESARACGLALVPEDRRDPLRTTTWGVGQLLSEVLDDGAAVIRVGLGGSATVDGGSGALSGLGHRVRTADGSGLKIGGWDLARVAAVEPGWEPSLTDTRIELWTDVATALPDAADHFGPQKGATSAAVDHLREALATWADVIERAFDAPGLRDVPGTGAAGGLAFGLAALGAEIVPGARALGDLLGLDEALAGAQLVVTGEGRLDATSMDGKVMAEVLQRSGKIDVPVVAVCGQVADRPPQLRDVEAASPAGPSADPRADVIAAATRLAARSGWT